jgi:hypothetical protein
MRASPATPPVQPRARSWRSWNSVVGSNQAAWATRVGGTVEPSTITIGVVGSAATSSSTIGPRSVWSDSSSISVGGRS